MNRFQRQWRVRATVIALCGFVASFLATGSVVQVAHAQAAPATFDPSRVAADAERCLAIDTEIAELTAQALKGTITPAASKVRIDALTAERLRLTTPYGGRNTPANRALTAEYNRIRAEARDAAAVEAKANRDAAAALAKAKKEAAVAEAAAKREAAAAEQQAKREAAVAAEAERVRLAGVAEDAATADASTVADERLQRARDKFYRDFGLPVPNSAAAVAQQGAAAQVVRNKYVAPGVAPMRPPFDERVERLFQFRLPDRTKDWFAEVFPSAADLVALFSNEDRKAAALDLASRRLSEHTTGVRPRAAQAKLEDYLAARNALKSNFAKAEQFARDKEFEAQVFEKNLPAYAVSLRQQAARERGAKEIEAFKGARGSVSGAIRVLLLVVFAWLPVRLMRRQKFRWKKQSQAGWEAQMANSPLPRELWWIEVPGFRYPVTLFSGRVYDKEIWTETNVTTTTTTTGGGGSGYYYSPVQTSTSTHVSSTVYHRYWMITTAGAQVSHRYSDNEFIATSGQKVSSIWSDNYWVLLSYNHATGSLSAPAWWTKTMHAPPYWPNIGVNLVAGLAVGMLVVTLAWPFLPSVTSYGFVDRISLVSSDAIAAVVTMIPLLMIYVAIVRAIFRQRRQSHLQKKVVPLYGAFLAGYDPVIPEAKPA